ncbi:MAG: ADOP family duplicated permease, partial [Longimicrobiaceae bacterium]
GRTLQLDGLPYQVVGVLPASFRYPRNAQLFAPFRYDAKYDMARERGTLIMTSVSRLAPGVSLERARLGMEDEARRWRVRFESEFKYASVQHTLVTVPLTDAMAGPLRVVTLVLLGAVGLVLLIACANVASLQFVRSTVRGKEMAVRAAVGGSPGQLARPLLVESAVLAALGGVCGLGVGVVLMKVLSRWAPVQSDALRELRLDPSVLVFTALATLVAGVVFGLAPAARAARTDPAAAMKDAGRGSSAGRGRTRALQRIIVAQVALTTVLLLGSGLLLRSLAGVLRADPGFDPGGVLTASVSLPQNGYDEPLRVTTFFTQALEGLRALPGVRAAALAEAAPLSGGGDSSPFRVVGRPLAPDAAPGHANMHTVSDDYFRALSIPLKMGRTFTSSDDAFGPRVVVIDEQLARQYFPGENPVGRQIDQGHEATLVGVVGSVSQEELGEAPKATTYYSYQQRSGIRAMTFVLRTGGDPAGLAGAVRHTLAEVDPSVAVYDVRTMDDRVRDSLGPRRFTAAVLGAFAVLSLLLTTLGVYGVLSYTTAQRAPELAIRIALGARQSHVVRMVVANGARMAGVGIAVGVAAFLAMGRVMAGLLYGVGPRDPGTVLLGAALLAAVALAASYVPAQWAARVDPALALRAD